MWDSRAETETVPPKATTAGAVIAQNAGLAHGVAWVITPTAGPDRWEAICCSQLAGVARWTWSHNSGKPTGNIWPLSSNVATSLTRESFMRSGIYYDAVSLVTTPQSAGAGIGSTHRSRRCSSHQALAEEPLGTPSTRRRGRRRWSAWSQSSCGRNAGRSGSPLGRSCKEFKAKPRGCCQGSRMDFDLKVKRGIPVWLSLFSCGVSMSGGTGRFAQASSQES